jgi:hypothetical protein
MEKGFDVDRVVILIPFDDTKFCSSEYLLAGLGWALFISFHHVCSIPFHTPLPTGCFGWWRFDSLNSIVEPSRTQSKLQSRF